MAIDATRRCAIMEEVNMFHQLTIATAMVLLAVMIPGAGLLLRMRLLRIELHEEAATHLSAFSLRKLASGKYGLYSMTKDPKTGRRRDLGTFDGREAAKHHEKVVQYFKRH